jgi:hypothetical protein
MDDKSTQFFEDLAKTNENAYCFECGAPSNHWASVNNGIFLCLNCSGLHRGFGVRVSFVRSVTMDTWSDLQLIMMKNGGNAKLRGFFESYGVPKDSPIDFKYKTKAGYYYREMLKALAEGKDIPTAPSLEEGLELVDSKNTNYKGQSVGFGSNQNQEEDFSDKVMDMLDKGVVTTKKVANDISDKFKDMKIKEEAQKVGTTISNGAKKVYGKVEETLTDPNLKTNVKEFGSKVATGTKETVNKLSEKSKEIWADRKEIANKGADMAKKGFGAASGFVKGLFGKKKETNEESKDAGDSPGESTK